MTSSLQPSWLSSLNTMKTISSMKLKHTSFKISFSLTSSSNAEEPSQPTEPKSLEITPPDPVKLAFEKAKAYRKSKKSTPDSKIEQNPDKSSAETGNGKKEVPASVKAAMEKAKEYKKNGGAGGSRANSDLKGEDGSIVEKKVSKKKEELRVSSMDFVGLNFADKKEGRKLPAGLVPLADPFPESDISEVEIIVGDSSNFGQPTTLKPEPTQEDGSEFYKPKVSTWGVFPRPGNISKTFGGGKVIRPGDVLETEEAKAAKEERTRQLLAAYKKRVGLNVDPKIKSECEKALKEGDSLMDSGMLKEALPYYEKVMDKMAFKSELHGLAALQWSICQDSLRRTNEARVMYEKLQSHPNGIVSKKAKQFVFSFQAMEMMKVRNSNLPSQTTAYQNFFEAFIEDKTNYFLQQESGVEEGVLNQALPYMIFLVSPIFMVLFIAVQKANVN